MKIDLCRQRATRYDDCDRSPYGNLGPYGPDPVVRWGGLTNLHLTSLVSTTSPHRAGSGERSPFSTKVPPVIKITLEYTSESGEPCSVSRQANTLVMRFADIGMLFGLVLLSCQGDILRDGDCVTDLYDGVDQVVGDTDLFSPPDE